MIINQTQKKVLIRNEKHCKNIIQKIKGLMFSKKKTLVFHFNKEQNMSIHMLFVFFPIDLYFLNKNKKVIEIKKNLKPFRLYTSKEKAQYLIETQKDNIKLNKNDILEF